ncbi:RluA family pseudouridine synthase [Mycoplasmoides genitalium]
MEQCFVVTTTKRLDSFLASLLNLSRVKVVKLIMNGQIKVNEKLTFKNSLIVAKDDVIKVEIHDETTNDLITSVEPYNLKLEVLFEDKDLMVINKPSGLLTHPTTFNEKASLLAACIFHNNKNPVYLVHRLDRDTSGAIVVCKNQASLLNLQNQLQNRTLKRYYVALVHFPFNALTGSINAPLARVNNNKVMFKIAQTAKAKQAITKFKVINQNEKAALISLELLTGRTHQIRVHLKFIQHPVYNDPLYGIKSEKKDSYGQFLHANRICFIHPTLNKPMDFHAPLEPKFSTKLKSLNLSLTDPLHVLFK